MINPKLPLTFADRKTFLNLNEKKQERLITNNLLKLHYNFDGGVLGIFLDHTLLWPQKGLNCKSFAYEVIT